MMGLDAAAEHRITSPLRGEVGATAPGEGFTLSAQSEGPSPLTLTLSPEGRGDTKAGGRFHQHPVHRTTPKDH